MIFRYLIFIYRIEPTSWLDNTLTSVLRFMLHSMVLRLMEALLTSRRVCGYSQVLSGIATVANWVVGPLSQQKKAKNDILFIGYGMTTNVITAARLIARKSINGKYQSK
jgi:hypothetical protein